MKITWIGHSCFRVEKDGYAVVIDPYEDGSVPGLKPVREKADLVLCSHEHGDHNARHLVKMTCNGTSPFRITELSTFHDDAKGTQRGKNTMFLLDDGETKLAHLGDLGCEPKPEQLEMLKGLDCLLIPVGGFYTIDAEQAAALVEKIKPRMVIPMHYRSGRFGFSVIGTVDAFSKLVGDVATVPASEIDTSLKLPAQVVILQPKNQI